MATGIENVGIQVGVNDLDAFWNDSEVVLINLNAVLHHSMCYPCSGDETRQTLVTKQ